MRKDDAKVEYLRVRPRGVTRGKSGNVVRVRTISESRVGVEWDWCRSGREEGARGVGWSSLRVDGPTLNGTEYKGTY